MNLSRLVRQKKYKCWEYLRQLVALLPRGIPWNFTIRDCSDTESNTSVWGEFLTVFALELSRLQDNMNKLLHEAVPGLSDELLDEWERIAGLPGDCGTLATTKAQRQQLVHAVITRGKGTYTPDEFRPLTKQYYEEYAQNFNMDITINDAGSNTVFRTTQKYDGSIQRVTRTPDEGIDGARLESLGSLHTWYVNVLSDPEGNESLLQCLFDKMRPAHTQVEFV